METSERQNIKYIYDLPYFERRELCRILDVNNKWEELGGRYMRFSMLTIQDLRREFLRGNSPTQELLTKWGHQNHTVLELFVLLSRMQHCQAMLVLKNFVDPKYHKLIYEGEESWTQMLRPLGSNSKSSSSQGSRLSGNSTQKDMQIAQEENRGINISEASTAVAPGPSRKPTSSLPGQHVDGKNMGVGRHNLNVTESEVNLPQKVTFPLQGRPEEKIINKTARPEMAVTRDQNVSSCGSGSQHIPPSPSPEVNGKNQYQSVTSSLAESCGSIPQISYKELVIATNNWDKANILGKGGFGTVFKGNWISTKVAIKRLEQRGAESSSSHQVQMEQSLRELRILNSYRHDNILPLYGFSIGGDEPCLVYQYMPNGSLEDRLLCRHGTKPLTWPQRLNIGKGTACGLQFLHTIGDKPLIHGDIKSANILLDINFEPRIGDFGLAREGPQQQYTHIQLSKVHGTRPYLPDEFLRNKKMSTKVDTYSFGIVLFEIATGLRAYDDTRTEKFLKDHVETCCKNNILAIMDRKAGFEDQDIFAILIQFGKHCICQRAKERPEMVVVHKDLLSIAARKEIERNAVDAVMGGYCPSNPIELQYYYQWWSKQRSMQSKPPSPAPALSPIHGGNGFTVSPSISPEGSINPQHARPQYLMQPHLSPNVQHNLPLSNASTPGYVSPVMLPHVPSNDVAATDKLQINGVYFTEEQKKQLQRKIQAQYQQKQNGMVSPGPMNVHCDELRRLRNSPDGLTLTIPPPFMSPTLQASPNGGVMQNKNLSPTINGNHYPQHISPGSPRIAGPMLHSPQIVYGRNSPEFPYPMQYVRQGEGEVNINVAIPRINFSPIPQALSVSPTNGQQALPRTYQPNGFPQNPILSSENSLPVEALEQACLRAGDQTPSPHDSQKDNFSSNDAASGVLPLITALGIKDPSEDISVSKTDQDTAKDIHATESQHSDESSTDSMADDQ